MNDERRPPDVPFIVHECETARHERTERRLLILCGIALAALVLTNGAWLFRLWGII